MLVRRFDLGLTVAAALVFGEAGARSRASVTADFDCDGKVDKALLVQDSGSIVVRVRFANHEHRPVKFAFPVSVNQQSAICAVPVELTVESLNYDPSDAVGQIAGFVPSDSCKGLVLTDNQCDPFHFYWNHKKKRFEWWRS